MIVTDCMQLTCRWLNGPQRNCSPEFALLSRFQTWPVVEIQTISSGVYLQFALHTCTMQLVFAQIPSQQQQIEMRVGAADRGRMWHINSAAWITWFSLQHKLSRHLRLCLLRVWNLFSFWWVFYCACCHIKLILDFYGLCTWRSGGGTVHVWKQTRTPKTKETGSQEGLYLKATIGSPTWLEKISEGYSVGCNVPRMQHHHQILPIPTFLFVPQWPLVQSGLLSVPLRIQYVWSKQVWRPKYLFTQDVEGFHGVL